MEVTATIKLLRDKGMRIGRVRKAIIAVFSQATKPLSALDVIDKLSAENISANKTTVYREIEFLKNHNFLIEVALEPSVRYFESAAQDHHHHLICEQCNNIQPIENTNLEMKIQKLTTSVLQSKQFKIHRHALEFYGVCNKCR